jgi:hypothetical protein
MTRGTKAMSIDDKCAFGISSAGARVEFLEIKLMFVTYKIDFLTSDLTGVVDGIEKNDSTL